MKVFIYDNKEKDCGGKYLAELISLLDNAAIEYEQIFDSDLKSTKSADAIFTLGGDGTILWIVEFANNNNIPIVGINVGKVGFLTEFERLEMADAVKLFKDNKLKTEERLTLEVSVNGITTCALNDAYIQRVYSESVGCMTADISVKIDGIKASHFKGDGVVVSSPTGSTAYSLSVGGAILSPEVEALSVTPIAAHALGLRSIVFSAQSICSLELTGRASGMLFVDGRLVTNVCTNDVVSVKAANHSTKFLRKEDYNFYKKLSLKLKDGFQG